jgi:hypothetical protein
MAVRDSIFGSGPENQLFNRLKTTWSKKGLELYPSLPFQTIINFKELGIPSAQRDYLYKTNIDYTICEQGRPLISVDFDGMGYGFSRLGEYVELKSQTDPNRKLKFDTKIAVCKEAKYPYFIVSFPEKQDLAPDLAITIVDGIVGQVLANRQVRATLQERVDEQMKGFENIPEGDRREMIQDIITDLEVEAEFEWDPTVLKAANYEEEAWKRGLTKGYSFSHIDDPPRQSDTEISWTLDPETLAANMKRYLEHQKHVIRIGCKVEVKTKHGTISQTCWVRNIEGYGASPLVISENIAKLIAFKKVLKSASSADQG